MRDPPETVVYEKCRYCRQADVPELGDACSACKERINCPKIGDGCAVEIGSDTYPATVVRVTPHTIVVRWDAEHGRGLTTSGAGRKMRFVKNGQGRWVHRSYLLSLGVRASRRDPSF